MKRFIILSILFAMIIYNNCSDCTNGAASAGTGTNTGGEGTSTGDNTQGGERRRLADAETCPKLKTSDDSKKKCVYNTEKKVCEEVDRDTSTSSSNMIKISLFLLISFMLI